MSDRLPQPVNAMPSLGVERASATPVVTLRGAAPRTGQQPSVARPQSLADVQRWMRSAIADDADLGLASVVLTASARLSADDRLEIYRAGYHARLVECLLDDYPVLATLLGEGRFHTLAHDYLARHPSTSPNLNGFGRHMSALCLATPGLDELRVVASELAALEWAIVEVLHASASPPLDLSAFAELAPEAWAAARLLPSEAVRLLRFSHPVNAYFQSVREGGSPPPPAAGASTTVVYRSELSVWRMDLTPAMTRVLESLLKGRPLGESLEAMAIDESDEEALGEASRSVMVWFREWVSGGLFGGIELESLRRRSTQATRGRHHPCNAPLRSTLPLRRSRRQPRSAASTALRHVAVRYAGAALSITVLTASISSCKRFFRKESLDVDAPAAERRCPADMVEVERRVCVDAYEASVVEVDDAGVETPHPPHAVVTGLKVRAVARGDVLPQAYISQTEARAACVEAGKRLCSDDEWKLACGGPTEQPYPYGATREDGACNDTAAVSPLNHYYDASRVGGAAYTWQNMNDPRLNQLPGGLAKTGAFAKCRGPLGIYDMVGNLHEWTETPSTFRGGYYLDTQLHGPGCRYQTTAHMPTYHDYSTGFRCCKDVNAAAVP